MDGDAFDWLCEAVADPANELSLGAYGAIGLFQPGGVRPVISVNRDRIVAEIPTASLRLDRHPALRPVAFEILSSDPSRWNHGIALCLPADAARMAGRRVVADLGPDREAIRAEDRSRGLFDLGLGAALADVCGRADGKRAAVIFEWSGHADQPSSGTSADLDHVFITAIGRLEVRSPSARFIEPRLIASGRSHAATTPIPEGFAPCGYVFPPNPSRGSPEESFDSRAHQRFQALFRRFGLPDHVELKAAVEDALDRSAGPDAVEVHGDRRARAVLRVTLRQRRRLAPRQDLSSWLAAFDRPALDRRLEEA